MTELELVHRIANDIRNRAIFIGLCRDLLPGGFQHRKATQLTDEIIEFIEQSDAAYILFQGPKVLNMLEPLLQAAIKSFPIKQDINAIATAFNNYCRENPSLYSCGLPIGWLQELVDTSSIYRPFLPYHTKVGIGPHAGHFAIEESIIIRDAFHFLREAENCYTRLVEFGEQLGKEEAHRRYTQLSYINSNVGTYSRTCILTGYSFVEAFVNSIGYDYCLRNESLLSGYEKECLLGKGRKGFHSLERKLEKIPEVTSRAGRQVVAIIDINQRPEPYKSFFEECKEIRDASVHFAPSKSPIVRTPIEWVENARHYIDLCLRVAKEFWKNCYPTRDLPDYLDMLNYDTLYRLAGERLEAMSEPI